MKRYFLFSLCAITPLLLKAEGTISLFENIDAEACVYEKSEVPQAADDPLYSIVLETQEANKDNTEQEPVSLETFDPADVQMEQESKDDLADAQTQQIPQETFPSKDSMCRDQTMCMPDIEPHQANMRHTESKGIGYNKGYTTLEGLFTFSRDKYIPFLDLRGHVFDNGRLAANAGIGTRYVLDPSKSMVGINTYYDYRNLKHAHFNQWGVGLEGFYDRWELRLNGYLPVGKKSIVSDHHLNGITFKKFQNNNLWINENYTDKVISAKKGFDLEVGVHPFKIMRDYDCLVAAGPYYFGGEGASGWGGKVRLKVEVAKYLFVELSNSYDKVFHNRFQGTLMLSLPFGGKKCYPRKIPNAAISDCFADNIMAWRGVQPVQRQEIIVAKKQTKSYIIDPIAINPATGDPIFITFVNNQDIFAGDGTFEHPYSTLANAQANTGQGSVIYVFAGDGSQTGYDTGWLLQDRQRFLGSAAAQDFSTTKGIVTVPIQTNLFPLITNASGGTVFLTPVPTISNEIAGISMQAQPVNPGVNITVESVIIKNNLFMGATTGFCVQVNSWGNVLVGSNFFTNITPNGNASLVINKNGSIAPNATVYATVSNNIFNGNNQGMLIQPESPSSAGILNATVTGNVISDTTKNAIRFFLNGGNITTQATINSNTAINSGNNGFMITQTATGTGFYHIFDNTVDGSGGAGFGGMLFTAGTAGQNLCLNVHDNLSVLNGAGAGYLFTTGGGTIFAEPFVNNIGTITGSATSVPPCFCKFCTVPDNN